MTAKSIMSFRLVKLKPTDKVCDALQVMHTQQIRNLPVVDENDQFVGLFSVRRLTRLMLPQAAQMNFGLQDLSFMPDEKGEMLERMMDVSQKETSDVLQAICQFPGGSGVAGSESGHQPACNHSQGEKEKAGRHGFGLGRD